LTGKNRKKEREKREGFQQNTIVPRQTLVSLKGPANVHYIIRRRDEKKKKGENRQRKDYPLLTFRQRGERKTRIGFDISEGREEGGTSPHL